ncbi:hypothetical protein GJ744_008017 [Endocarpon pusillum]|uniref:Uncharacterized protein n=1 Tax=Endocarpon pusillum TaxID=364733 RepID=A0A8H7E3R9_9EURO|nr:hypothetical protein GJ744_008017 [Endocarpon pusillum]
MTQPPKFQENQPYRFLKQDAHHLPHMADQTNRLHYRNFTMPDQQCPRPFPPPTPNLSPDMQSKLACPARRRQIPPRKTLDIPRTGLRPNKKSALERATTRSGKVTKLQTTKETALTITSHVPTSPGVMPLSIHRSEDDWGNS